MVTINGVPTVESLIASGMKPNIIVRFFLWLKRNSAAENAAAKRGCQWSHMFLKPTGEDMEWLLTRVADGKLKPVIDSRYPLSKATEAVERSFSGRAAGKVIIEVMPGDKV